MAANMVLPFEILGRAKNWDSWLRSSKGRASLNRGIVPNLLKGRRTAWIKTTTLIRNTHNKERNEPIHIMLCAREGGWFPPEGPSSISADHLASWGEGWAQHIWMRSAVKHHSAPSTIWLLWWTFSVKGLQNGLQNPAKIMNNLDTITLNQW